MNKRIEIESTQQPLCTCWLSAQWPLSEHQFFDHSVLALFTHVAPCCLVDRLSFFYKQYALLGVCLRVFKVQTLSCNTH